LAIQNPDEEPAALAWGVGAAANRVDRPKRRNSRMKIILLKSSEKRIKTGFDCNLASRIC
jgi:hypothetical protein